MSRFGSSILSRLYGGARNEETLNFLLNTLIFTQNAGEQVHTKVMTLILDQDTGNTEDL